ncbi:MAG TPA: hypothetical protein VJ596_10240 [Gemmatimonadaceae bacterium]|nr:hypothetical protein [Gemmatimonadaceae bacterium]
MLALGLAATVVAWEMTLGVRRGVWRALMLAFAWTLALGLTVVIPDFRILVVVAYAPILLLGAPFGWPPGIRFSDALPWPLINQLVCMTGGLLWAATALAYQRGTRGACQHCGRVDGAPSWTAPSDAARWGKLAVAVAVLVPVIYAITRWAWALGFPLGISEEFFREGVGTGLWWRGAALATLALVGALLTLGLTQRWGEVFPRWVPLLGGNRVPPMLAIAPATFVALIAATAGLMFLRVAVRGDFALGRHAVTFSRNWAALWPELLWPLWGVALGAATLAYYFRTRGRCVHCGRL